MGKKPHRRDWPEAKKLCRLNQLDIEMAKKVGFGPDALIRARPDPKQRWKLPVKEWVHELYEKKFGKLLTAETPPKAEVRKSPAFFPPDPDERDEVIIMDHERGFPVNMSMIEESPPIVWLDETDEDEPV